MILLFYSEANKMWTLAKALTKAIPQNWALIFKQAFQMLTVFNTKTLGLPSSLSVFQITAFSKESRYDFIAT